MFLNDTTKYLLDDNIVKVLQQKKCPIIVYRKISLYVPLNEKKLNDFKYIIKEGIKLHIYVKEVEEILFKELLLKANLTNNQMNVLLGNFVTHRQIVRNVLSVLKENHKKGMSVGAFVKIRRIIRSTGLILDL